MALYITDECINCDVCEEHCPNQAITPGFHIYTINHTQCTECIGHFSEAQCVSLCPVDCILPDPKHLESEEELKNKFFQLYPQENI